MIKSKVVIFIDQVAAKNKLQVSILQQAGFEPVFFVTHQRVGAEQMLAKAGSQALLATGFFNRCRQLYTYLSANRGRIHHLEIYPGGRFSFIYLLLGKW